MAITKTRLPALHAFTQTLTARELTVVRDLDRAWPAASHALERLISLLDPAEQPAALRRALRGYTRSVGAPDRVRLLASLVGPLGRDFLLSEAGKTVLAAETRAIVQEASLHHRPEDDVELPAIL